MASLGSRPWRGVRVRRRDCHTAHRGPGMSSIACLNDRLCHSCDSEEAPTKTAWLHEFSRQVLYSYYENMEKCTFPYNMNSNSTLFEACHKHSYMRRLKSFEDDTRGRVKPRHNRGMTESRATGEGTERALP